MSEGKQTKKCKSNPTTTRGTKAMREIRKYQRLDDLALKPRQVPFRELAAGVMRDSLTRRAIPVAKVTTEKLK